MKKEKGDKGGRSEGEASGSDEPSKEYKAKTWVHSIFEGVLTNETRCLCCETVTSRDECFLDLSVEIEQNSSVSSLATHPNPTPTPNPTPNQVADFGLARVVSGKDMMKTACGTPVSSE